MKLSVIVTIYNREESLRHCLDSLLNQKFQDYEIILVDDGSTDGSREIVKEYEEKAPDRVCALYQENHGVASARNAGLAAARGEYVTYVDSDDYLADNSLSVVAEIAEKRNADIVLYDAFVCLPDGRRRNFAPFYDTMEGMKTGWIRPQDYMLARPCPWNQWTRKSLFQQVFGDSPPFPEGRIYEDLGTMPCLAKAAEKIFYFAVPVYIYFLSEESIMRAEEYNPKFDDIFPMVQRIQDYMGEDYPKETEYLFWEHLLISGGKRYLAHEKYDQAEHVADYMRQEYPDWRRNPYLKREPKSKKILAWLMQRKKWNLIRILTKLK